MGSRGSVALRAHVLCGEIGRDGMFPVPRTPLSLAEFCPRIIDAAPGATVVVVGTLYKDMALKPNILDEFSAEVRAGGG